MPGARLAHPLGAVRKLPLDAEDTIWSVSSAVSPEFVIPMFKT
jgi:hypothetical protein